MFPNCLQCLCHTPRQARGHCEIAEFDSKRHERAEFALHSLSFEGVSNSNEQYAKVSTTSGALTLERYWREAEIEESSPVVRALCKARADHYANLARLITEAEYEFLLGPESGEQFDPSDPPEPVDDYEQ